MSHTNHMNQAQHKHPTVSSRTILMRLACLSLLLGLLSACLVSQPKDTRGWTCESDADCFNQLFCYKDHCRATCTSGDDLDCAEVLNEVCNTDLYCVPAGPLCEEGKTRPCYDGPSGTNGKGPCKNGIQTCKSSKWGTCEKWVGPGSESDNPCNGVDDDCDGTVDEGNNCQCKPGASRSCYGTAIGCTKSGETYNCVGVCKSGTQTCGSDNKWGDCSGWKGPDPAELCNGLDDNCDGDIDNNVTDDKKDCTIEQADGPCKAGKSSCDLQAGKLLCTSSHKKTQEDCNGIDDDCDGSVDNFAGGNTPLFKECVTTNSGCKPDGSGSFTCTGTCAAGRLKCLNPQNIWSTVCEAEVRPTKAETCDGKDNDCNGTVDDNSIEEGKSCDTSGKGICKPGTTECVGGNVICKANKIPAGQETCNGLDDDCNGTVDETPNNCISGKTCQNGSCQ